MTLCPFCNTYVDDSASVCPNCGNALSSVKSADNSGQPNYGAEQPPYGNQYNYQQNQPPMVQYDPSDHTTEFSVKDISDNKVIAMLVYLLGTVGIFLALIGSKESPYVAFHVRQAMKIKVCEILLSIGSILLCWTGLVPLAAFVCSIILLVLTILAFFQICGGKAKEPAIIKNLKFLK